MSFRYTSDVEIAELQDKVRPLDGTEAILIVQDGRSYKCTLQELITDLQVSTSAVYVDWAFVANVPPLSGATSFNVTAPGQVQAVDIPRHQVSHFVNAEFNSGSSLDIIMPLVSTEVPMTGVQVTVRASLRPNSSVNVREGSASNAVIASESSTTQSFVWTALFAHNGTQWKYVPLESLTL